MSKPLLSLEKFILLQLVESDSTARAYFISSYPSSLRRSESDNVEFLPVHIRPHTNPLTPLSHKSGKGEKRCGDGGMRAAAFEGKRGKEKKFFLLSQVKHATRQQRKNVAHSS